MRAGDKKAISDAAGIVITSVRAVGGGDDSEVNVLPHYCTVHAQTPT